MIDKTKIVRFNDDIICSNAERTDGYISKLLNDGSTLGSLAAGHGKITYVSDEIEATEKPEKEKQYKWAFIDLKRKFHARPIYYLAEYDPETLMYDGYLIGDPDHIMGRLEKDASIKGKMFYERYNALHDSLMETTTAVNKEIEERASATTAKEYAEAMYHDIYTSLLINNWCSEAGLTRFIKIAGTRLKELRDAGATRYFEESPARYAVINTGLIDTYKEDILVMYRWNVAKDTYLPYRQVKGRMDWLENGFTAEQACRKLKSLRFLEPSDSLGDIDASVVDIPTDAYRHIIDENRDRMVAVIGEDFSREMIADKIRSAVSTCLKMLERDPGYAKPYYTTTMGLSWMLPLYIKSGLDEEPEFGLILAKRAGGWYEVKTAIPYSDETKDGLTATSLYGKNW